MPNEVIQPMDRAVIQIWDSHPAIPLEQLSVRVQDKKISLSQDIEARVSDNWQKTQASNPSAKDQQVAYLLSYSRDKENQNIQMKAFMRGYRYNQWFNLDDVLMTDTRAAIESGLTPVTFWMLALSKNRGTALFGRKINYGAQKVSGFGGYMSLEDPQTENVNLCAHTKKKITEEIGDLEIASYDVIGLNFFPRVGHRTFNEVILVALDATSEQIQETFKPSSQFGKGLIPVPANPYKLLEFLESSAWQPTWSCIGGLFNYILSTFGRDEFNKALARYSHKDSLKVLEPQFRGDAIEMVMQSTYPNSQAAK